MQHRSAFALLDAIRHERGVQASYAALDSSDGDRMWLVCAVSADGQIWRSRHADLLLAVVILEKMLNRIPVQNRFDGGAHGV